MTAKNIDITKPVYMCGYNRPLHYIGFVPTPLGNKLYIFAYVSKGNEIVSYIEYNCGTKKAFWVKGGADAHLTNTATESEANLPKTPQTQPKIYEPPKRLANTSPLWPRAVTYAVKRPLNTTRKFYRPFFPHEVTHLAGVRLVEHKTGEVYYLNHVGTTTFLIGTHLGGSGSSHTPQEALSRFDYKDAPFGVEVTELTTAEMGS